MIIFAGILRHSLDTNLQEGQHQSRKSRLQESQSLHCSLDGHNRNPVAPICSSCTTSPPFEGAAKASQKRNNLCFKHGLGISIKYPLPLSLSLPVGMNGHVLFLRIIRVLRKRSIHVLRRRRIRTLRRRMFSFRICSCLILHGHDIAQCFTHPCL